MLSTTETQTAAASFPPGIKFLNTIAETMRATGRSRSGVYQMIANGELEAVKDGARTLIPGQSIVLRTATLPRAVIGKKAAA